MTMNAIDNKDNLDLNQILKNLSIVDLKMAYQSKKIRELKQTIFDLSKDINSHKQFAIDHLDYNPIPVINLGDITIRLANAWTSENDSSEENLESQMNKINSLNQIINELKKELTAISEFVEDSIDNHPDSPTNIKKIMDGYFK